MEWLKNEIKEIEKKEKEIEKKLDKLNKADKILRKSIIIVTIIMAIIFINTAIFHISVLYSAITGAVIIVGDIAGLIVITRIGSYNEDLVILCMKKDTLSQIIAKK